MPSLVLSIWFIVGSSAWSPDKTKFPSDYKKPILFFGQGGGFTGAVTTYAILDNGRFFKKTSLTEKEFHFIGKLSKSETSQLFNNYTFLGLPSLQLEDPGNLYHFVEYSLKKNNHRITWGGSEKPPDNLKLFYSLLNHLIPNP